MFCWCCISETVEYLDLSPYLLCSASRFSSIQLVPSCFLIVSFAVQKPFSWMSSNLFALALIACPFGDFPKKDLPVLIPCRVLPLFPFNSLKVSRCRFSSSIYLKYRWGSCILLQQADNQLSQQHLLKGPTLFPGLFSILLLKISWPCMYVLYSGVSILFH